MNVRQSILGEIAVRSGHRLAGVDVGSLVRRLILFDRVIVKSFRLREAPTLVRVFGKAGFLDLLSLGLLKFSCEFEGVISDLRRNGIRPLPLDHFSFSSFGFPNRETVLRSELGALQSIAGLNNKERSSIEEAIQTSIVRPPGTYIKDLLAQIESDLRTNTPALKCSILKRLQEEIAGSEPHNGDIPIQVEEVQERVFYIRNTLADRFGFSAEKAHEVLEAGVTAVACLNHRLADMQAYFAITGFLESEAPLLFGKLSGIVAPLNPNLAEEQFERVIELADLPDFKQGQRVDVQKLLQARDSAECREFREWLSTVDDASDAEIKEMVASLKSKMASLAASPGGKLVRLAATTGIGLIPGVGLLTGAAAGLVDSFLVEKVLPRSGIVAFLTETYPSLFVWP